ncbi:FxsA family protein [Phaeovibrio sulfidiphilus]|uniref:FxsA family protein n=1 Tax=Phaeovibrio sulfidiphilus TaxID=1220600 RepID=A0A8J6YMY7_9PROT|nr:FxsA family protein [Phaeovibrio sulfidiphilus]MBE1236849.1 FxsA family protein [Phaeovibrio sulfidiphilus]
MGGPLFLLFLLSIPFVEIALFIEVGKALGVFETILLTLAISAVGFIVMQKHSMQTAMRVRESLARGQPPVKEMFDNACVVVGGLLMILPGFLTDTIGILLLLPPVHEALRGYLERRGTLRTGMGPDAGRGTGGFSGSRPGSGSHSGGRVIDGEFTEVVESETRAGAAGPDDADSRGASGGDHDNPWAHVGQGGASGTDRKDDGSTGGS